MLLLGRVFAAASAPAVAAARGSAAAEAAAAAGGNAALAAVAAAAAASASAAHGAHICWSWVPWLCHQVVGLQGSSVCSMVVLRSSLGQQPECREAPPRGQELVSGPWNDVTQGYTLGLYSPGRRTIQAAVSAGRTQYSRSRPTESCQGSGSGSEEFFRSCAAQVPGRIRGALPVNPRCSAVATSPPPAPSCSQPSRSQQQAWKCWVIKQAYLTYALHLSFALLHALHHALINGMEYNAWPWQPSL